jgi:NADH-quinone oxidoreductase subunit L
MTATKTAAWLCLLLPLAGTLVNALGFRVFKGKVPGYIGTLFLAGSFAAAVAMFFALQGLGEEERQVRAIAA